MEIMTTPKRKEILGKRNIYTQNDLLHYFPRKYNDYTKVYREVNPQLDGACGCFVGMLDKIEKKSTDNKCSLVKFKLRMNTQQIAVTMFGQAYMYNILRPMEKKQVVVCGTLQYTPPYGFVISAPDHIVPGYKLQQTSGIEPVYTHISGISDEVFSELMNASIDSCTESYKVEDSLWEKYGISGMQSLKDAYTEIHHPQSINLDKAYERVAIDDMLSLSVELERQSRNAAKGTSVLINSTKIITDIIKHLPYSLTEDQNKYCKTMLLSLMDGRRVSALVQGDVGCGKTMVSILMLFLLAENGYQGVLMAPTAILAKQHYEEIRGYGEKYGIAVEYLDGTISTSAKKKIRSRVKTGEVKILVGTQTLVSTDIEYNKLGIVIIDEEHRFGVRQRSALLDKAAEGVSTLSMSATPIPRTLAGVLYNSNTEIYDIHSMPSNRKAVQTAINNSDRVIYEFIDKQLAEGRQAYVVCPLIESNDEKKGMEGVKSAEEVYEEYTKRFSPRYKVACLNGKMKEFEMEETIQAFKNNDIQILVSTTVIEVGVNVPNASVIVISNAERFGLATMHQLRGRVGRGQYKSYCILKSADKGNPRLKVMVDNTDGFKIAEEDMKLRGAGDLVGTRQSGSIRSVDLVMRYPDLYSKIREIAKVIVNREQQAYN